MKQQEQPVPVTPVVMRGLGRALPRGESLLVPFNCDVIACEQLEDTEDSNLFVEQIGKSYEDLFQYCITSKEL